MAMPPPISPADRILAQLAANFARLRPADLVVLQAVAGQEIATTGPEHLQILPIHQGIQRAIEEGPEALCLLDALIGIDPQTMREFGGFSVEQQAAAAATLADFRSRFEAGERVSHLLCPGPALVPFLRAGGEGPATPSPKQISEMVTTLETPIGPLALFSHQGIGYKDRNEDGAVAVAFGGEVCMITIDAMGATDFACEAKEFLLTGMLAVFQREGAALRNAILRANHLLRGFDPDAHSPPDAVFAAASLRRGGPGDPFPVRMSTLSAGDATVMVLRRGRKGGRQILFRSALENWPSLINRINRINRDPLLDEAGMKLHRTAAQVSNSFRYGDFARDPSLLKTTGSGIFTPAKGLDGLQPISLDGDDLLLQEGDLVLSFSDGIDGNFLFIQSLLDLIDGMDDPAQIVRVAAAEVLARQAVFAAAMRRPDPRTQFRSQGGTLFIDRGGRVWRDSAPQPDEGRPIDLYKPDNMTLQALVVRPTGYG